MKNNKFKKIIASCLAIILTLGIVVPTTVEIAEAAKVKIIKEGEIDLPGASSVIGKFLIGGKRAFCMQHNKLAPASGTSLNKKVYNNKNVQKTLYYGWAGEEPWDGFKAGKQGGVSWTKEEHGIVLTSLLLSCYYNGDSFSSYDYIRGFTKFREYVAGKPNIKDYRAYFESENKSVKLTGKWNAKLGLQKTSNVKISGKAGNSIKFTLPKGVTMVNAETGAKDIEKVTAKVGQSHYFTAKSNVTGTFKTGTVGRTWLFQPFIFIKDSSVQVPGGWERVSDPNAHSSLSIKWSSLGNAQVTKKSESGKAIKGAKFNIKNADGSLNKNGTTDENGKILFSNLAPGTYTVTETSVPSPYLIDKTPKTVTVKANDTGEVSFTNNLPRGEFTLTKTKENGSPLVGAKFRIWSVGNDPEGVPINYSKDFTTDGNGNITRFLFLSAFNLTFFICQHQY